VDDWVRASTNGLDNLCANIMSHTDMNHVQHEPAKNQTKAVAPHNPEARDNHDTRIVRLRPHS